MSESVGKLVEELKSLGSETTKRVLMKHGAQEPFFGVKIEHLKKIQKRIKMDADGEENIAGNRHFAQRLPLDPQEGMLRTDIALAGRGGVIERVICVDLGGRRIIQKKRFQIIEHPFN